jgi:NAD(P)-dependent dehydrogenase (short-subunit alcohol dehydrogenase family)
VRFKAIGRERIVSAGIAQRRGGREPGAGGPDDDGKEIDRRERGVEASSGLGVGDRGELALVGAALGVADRRPLEAPPGEQPWQLRVRGDVVEERARVRREIVGREWDGVEQFLEAALEDGVEERLLVAEVHVDQALVGLRLLGDAIHASAGQAVVRELCGSGADDPRLRGGGVSRSRLAVKRAHEHFGRLDIVVNNAGYGLFGTVEEVSEEQVRDQFETNVFGALWVTKAALPYLREQGSGYIVQVSSFAGVNAFPTMGIYNASKWALEGFTRALAAEVRDLGIKVTLIEPTAYATEFGAASAAHADQLPAYDGARAAAASFWATQAFGDPQATGQPILDVVDAEEPTLRVFFGTGPLDVIRDEYAQRIATWEQWNQVSEQAMGTLAHAA